MKDSIIEALQSAALLQLVGDDKPQRLCFPAISCEKSRDACMPSGEMRYPVPVAVARWS
jgi:hypothetical protein